LIDINGSFIKLYGGGAVFERNLCLRGFGKCNAFWSIALPLVHSGRSPYRWNFNIMDSHMRYVFQNTFISQDSAIDQNVLHLLKPR